jgi:hypothetical protein
MGSPSPICISTSFLCWFWIVSSYFALTTFMPKCAVKMDMVRVDRLVNELSLKNMVSNHLTHAYSEHSWLHHRCIQIFFILKESFWLAHQQVFLEHWHALNRSTSFDLPFMFQCCCVFFWRYILRAQHFLVGRILLAMAKISATSFLSSSSTFYSTDFVSGLIPCIILHLRGQSLSVLHEFQPFQNALHQTTTNKGQL